LGVISAIRHRPLIILAFLGIVALAGCGDSGSKVFRRFTFKVDTSQVGQIRQVDDVSLAIPRGWDSLVGEAASELARVDSFGLSMSVRAAYGNSSTGSTLLMGEFENGPRAGVNEFVSWAHGVVASHQEARAPQASDEAWLDIGGAHVVQLTSGDSIRVHFGLILEGKPPLGLVFTVPQSAAMKDIKAVESSIGTIRKVQAAKHG
jgi:hypothetical protein